jgi:DNA-binding protein HU-beta
MRPVGEAQELNMNKRDLIDAISGRLGDKKSATEAVNAVLETIQSAVANGDKVAITGFGVFEKSERPARTARNPSTGATIEVPESSVPKFRPGADFKALVNAAPKKAAKK